MNQTVFDDVYKTIQEKFPKLLIPVVNELFHTDYALNEVVENLASESHRRNEKVIADSVFRIRNHLYHMECQSNPDGTIAIRMLEYDFYIAMKTAEKGPDGVYYAKMPRSCVIYLRHNHNTPEEEIVKLVLADGTVVSYRVSVIKLQEYSIDEIFEKGLLMFLLSTL